MATGNVNQTFDPAGGGSSGGGWLKGCLIGCGVVAVIGILVAVVGGYFVWQWGKKKLDPVVVAEKVQQTVEYESPGGYKPLFGMDMTAFDKGLRMLMIGPEGVQMEAGGNRPDLPNHTHFIFLVFVGLPPEQLDEALEQQRVQQGLAGPGVGDDQGANKETFETANGSIDLRGQKLTQQGNAIVQYQVHIKPGAVLMAQGPADDFDMDAFKALLKSMTVEQPEEVDAAVPDVPDPAKDPEPKDDDAPTVPKPKKAA